VTRPAARLLLALALAVASAVLGGLGNSGPLVPLLAGGVVAGGLVGGQVALLTGMLALGPLLAVIGSGHWRLQVAGGLLSASSLLFWLEARRRAQEPPGELVMAARIVLAAGALTSAAALAVFVRVVG
jgi:hypothetical protein